MSGFRSKHNWKINKHLVNLAGRMIFVVFLVSGFIPLLLVQASQAKEQRTSRLQQDDQGWSWKLIESSQSDEWQGDNFHGLKSEYTPIFNDDTIGAVYTQYNIQFDPDTPMTIASAFTGTCTWLWEKGSIPGDVVPGTGYPFTLAVDANATGSNFLGGTVNGYTLQGDESFAFVQVYLDVNGEVRSGHQEGSFALSLSPGQKEGDRLTVTTQCQVDIVTVKVQYLYEWSPASCFATLKLPDEMKPNQDFTPQAIVVDRFQRTIQPDSGDWFINGEPSSQTMKWDGKAGVVEYEYICPNETTLRRSQINVPAAPSCLAKIILPEKMEPEKTFIAKVEVVDPDKKPVKPESEAWFYNGVPSSATIKWDGNAATVDYEFICPLDLQPGKTSISIPQAEKGSGWQVVVGGLAAVAAIGLAAVAAGAALVKSGGKKGPPPPKYILQLNKNKLEVNHKQSAALSIRAWKINPDGSTVPAPEAVIQVAVPASPALLVASPVSGQGSLECIFSAPKPKECADLSVKITSSANLMKTSAQILVRVVPVYELELKWFDPQLRILKPEAREIYACARLTATPPPDPQTTPDKLAEKIGISIEGPNRPLVQLTTSPPTLHKPYAREGMLWIPIRLSAPPPGSAESVGNPTLFAKFNDGNQRLEKSLSLELSPGIKLGTWVKGTNQADVLFNKRLEIPAWDFSEIIVYFHEPENDRAPAHPTFEYGLDNDAIEFDPPLLVVREIYSHAPDQYTIQTELAPGADVEEYFGSDLRERNGIIQVRITVKTKDGKNYSNGVSYWLRPQLELFAHGSDASGRTYKGLDFKPEEFLADGSDELKVFIGVCRSDKPEERIAGEVDLIDPGWWTFSESLAGSNTSQYSCEHLDETEAGDPQLLIRSIRPMLYKEEWASEKFSLHLEASPTSALPGNFLRTPLRFELPIQPHFPNLRLWVVPGKNRSRSEAWMFAFLDQDPAQPLPDTVLKIKTESTAGGSGPVLLTNSLQKETSVISGADGSEQVNLVYKGLNWTNLNDALFTVSGCITNDQGDQESEPVKIAVNVKENVSTLLADLFDRAEMLKLNNPYYENRSFGLSSLIDLTEYRPFVRGLVWNICEEFSGNEKAYASGDKKAKFAHDYVCSEFRDRIAEWLIRRRHYQAGDPDKIEQIALMNGIEFEHFVIADGLHNYEGLFLSGMSPTDDPRGLDPWWKQNWKDRDYLTPDGLITNNWERYYSVETSGWLTVSLAPLAALGVLAGGFTVPILLGMLGTTIAAYAAVTAGEVASGTVYSNGEYKWFRKNIYTGREVFIKDWIAAHPNG